MALYNIVHGENDRSDQILNLLNYEGFDVDDFDWGRYRDVYIKDKYVVVHTRNGGGNRPDYKKVFKAVRKHPYYSYDEDCDFDGTYADIYFKIPHEKREILDSLRTDGDNPCEKWERLFGMMG